MAPAVHCVMYVNIVVLQVYTCVCIYMCMHVYVYTCDLFGTGTRTYIYSIIIVIKCLHCHCGQLGLAIPSSSFCDPACLCASHVIILAGSPQESRALFTAGAPRIGQPTS